MIKTRLEWTPIHLRLATHTFSISTDLIATLSLLFKDPSVQNVTRNAQRTQQTLDDYNPFASSNAANVRTQHYLIIYLVSIEYYKM